MTKTFAGATAGLRSAVRGSVAAGRFRTNRKAEYRPPITKFERTKDTAAFWGLRIYVRVLMVIGWATELQENHTRKAMR